MSTGQLETVLPDGRQVVSVSRVVEDGARAMLFLVPGVLRVDVIPQPDMFRLVVRGLAADVPVAYTTGDRPATVLMTDGLDHLDLPLLGSAAIRLDAAGRTWKLTLGNLRIPDRGATAFTVQAIGSERHD